MEKICSQITVAAFMQPLQYDLRSPAAKDNSITHAAVARSNLDAAITMRSAETELQNTIELRATGVQNPISTPERKKDDFEALFRRILRRKITSAKMEKICWQITVAAFMQPLQYDLRSPAAKDNSITHAAKRESNTCNPIYIAGTILQLQITMEFHRQLIHQHHLQSHSQCGNDPTVANHNGILSTTHARKTVETPFTMRNRSENDPSMIWTYPTTHETVSQPSHRRGRSSRFGDGLCMEKHRVSCICYLSKTHFVRDFLQNSIGNSSTSTTCNAIYIAGSILQLQITMEFHRQLIQQHHLQSHLHCGNDPTVANHNGILSTTHARKTLDTPFTMRNRSENDPSMIRTYPTTHETVSQPSHRRGRSSRFGDGLCMEKHRVSCICYLSKTHFVRDFLQNSIGNSSTSTTCNAIYSEDNPTVANHNALTNSFPH